MARNGRRKKVKSGLKSIGNKIFPFVKAVSAPLAFFEQVTAKDRQTLGNTFSQASTTTQLKILANISLGRVAGITPFHKLGDGTILPTAPQTINPSGIINKWTTAGLIGIAYGIIGKAVNNMSRNMGLGSVVPEVSKVKSIGKSVFIGGAFGGFFDDPVAGGQTSHIVQSFPSLSANRNVIRVTSRGSSMDSGLSSFD